MLAREFVRIPCGNAIAEYADAPAGQGATP